MPQSKSAARDELSKFQRSGKTRRERGMKLLRVWAPDPRRPEFAREAEWRAELLRGRSEEREALKFIEAAFEWPEP